jgi:hypothetical protein
MNGPGWWLPIPDLVTSGLLAEGRLIVRPPSVREPPITPALLDLRS